MSTALPPAAESIGYMVKAAQHLIRQRLDAALSDCGLSTAQYALLSALEGTEAPSGAELARRCFITPQSVNSLLATLERDGMIRRSASASHGRVIETALTETGRERLSTAHRLAQGIEEQMLTGIPPEHHALLASMLGRIIRSLG